MASALDELSNLAMKVYALSSAARSCRDYETGMRLAREVQETGEALKKIAPKVFEEMTDGILRRLMEMKFPEVKGDPDGV